MQVMKLFSQKHLGENRGYIKQAHLPVIKLVDTVQENSSISEWEGQGFKWITGSENVRILDFEYYGFEINFKD